MARGLEGYKGASVSDASDHQGSFRDSQVSRETKKREFNFSLY